MNDRTTKTVNKMQGIKSISEHIVTEEKDNDMHSPLDANNQNTGHYYIIHYHQYGNTGGL